VRRRLAAWRRVLDAPLAAEKPEGFSRASRNILAGQIQAEHMEDRIPQALRGYEASNRLSGEVLALAIVGLADDRQPAVRPTKSKPLLQAGHGAVIRRLPA
jgi:hypothetical protein